MPWLTKSNGATVTSWGLQTGCPFCFMLCVMPLSTSDTTHFYEQEPLWTMGSWSLHHTVSWIAISSDSSLDFCLLKGRTGSCASWEALLCFPIYAQGHMLSRLNSPVSQGGFLQSHFPPWKADCNEKVVYTRSDAWFLRTSHVTSNGYNNPRLLWSSNELKSLVSCEVPCIWQLVMTWIYGASLIPQARTQASPAYFQMG